VKVNLYIVTVMLVFRMAIKMNPVRSSTLALIPARGGSKRLQRKNILSFFGRPILAWTIDAAYASGRFSRVVVSTEDAEIKQIALSNGAEVDDRPQHLATDLAGVIDVCLDFLAREREAGKCWDVLCCLYATAPLRNADDIIGVLDLLGPDCSFAMAVTTYSHPPFQALRTDEHGTLVPMWSEFIDMKSQDVPKLLVDNGSTYAVSIDEFSKAASFYGPGLRGHLMPQERSVDIDMPEDMELAELYARRHLK